MREVTENCVVLRDISVSVFKLVLKAIYSGEDILTLDNFIEVWRAVHQLQIKFMITICETFATKSISATTWEKIYKTAKLLNSETVMGDLYNFMLINFDNVSLTSTFLILSFEEVLDLIKSQDLVASREDLVLEAVIKWVQYITPSSENEETRETDDIVENKSDKSNTDIEKDVDIKSEDQLISILYRKSKLAELLTAVRTCLVSPTLLRHIFKLELISEDKDAREIIFNALSYHVQDFRDGQWSSAAIHRSCYGYIQFGVWANSDGTIRVIGAGNEKRYTPSKSNYLQREVKLVVFDNDLYATGIQAVNNQNVMCRLLVFSEDTWVEVMQMPGRDLLLVSHGQCIYILNRSDNVMYNIKPKQRTPKLIKFSDAPAKVNVKHAMSLANYILIFCSVTQNGVDETAVYTLDVHTKVWTRLDNLEGPAEQLISFRNDRNNYILQTNGSLWMIEYKHSLKTVNFKYIVKLWNFDKKLYGALTYRDKLLIFGNNPTKDPKNEKILYNVSDHFLTVRHWGSDDNCSNFIPVTLPNRSLLPDT
ncbi:uncharacterized protein LOC131947074 [Physella acuta]|uniref:uncharacterized protein LOC131947074 n=1 Tax=Physella acuta TaxID=109671 RepID=UPI0027DC6B32|nr:uncharacterized protein LOC131947074 [Physella acuta]